MGPSTIDSICRGELSLEQPRRGYRFNVDSVILADFTLQAMRGAETSEVEVVDLGAGCGVVGLLVARRLPGSRVVLVELQQDLADLARANAIRNGLEHRTEVRCADLLEEEAWIGSKPDLVVSNAPYFRVGAGRISQNSQVALAKHELTCNLPQLLAVCGARLDPGAHLCLIHSYERLDEIGVGLRRHGFGAVTVQPVQPLPDRPFNRVLVHAVKGEAFSFSEQAALVVESMPGTYSPSLRRILGEA